MNAYHDMVPATPSIRIPEKGEPYLEGFICADCGQAFLEEPSACPKCGSRKPMYSRVLEPRGTVYSYTIVHRSFPGVKTPFVMVVVDMADGLTMRASLEGVAPEPSAVAFDMPVRLEFRDSGQADAEGHHYLSYVFVPDKGAAQ